MTEQVPTTGVDDESRERVTSTEVAPGSASSVDRESAGSAPADATAPRTGVPSVDAVLDDLEGLDSLPLEEHVGAFERAHEALRSALDAAPDAPVTVPDTGADNGNASGDVA